MEDLFGYLTDEDYLSLLLEQQRPYTQMYQDEIAQLSQCPVEQRMGVPVPRNYIGERIQYLLEQEGADIASFCLYAGISRSTMHRYLKGTHLPSKKNLLSIIQCLGITAEEFARHPDDFELWKKSLLSDKEQLDFFKMCDMFRSQFEKYSITYTTHDGKEKKIPYKQCEIFCKLFDDAVEMLRFSLND